MLKNTYCMVECDMECIYGMYIWNVYMNGKCCLLRINQILSSNIALLHKHILTRIKTYLEGIDHILGHSNIQTVASLIFEVKFSHIS